MERFSAQWVKRLDEVLRSNPPPVEAQLKIAYVVLPDDNSAESAQGERIGYTIHVDGDSACVVDHATADADVTFVASRIVADAIANSSAHAYEELMLGRLEIHGDPTALIGNEEISAWLEQTVALVN